MAAYKSTQETKRTASPPKMLAAHELKGRVRVAWFDYTVPTGGVAVDDTVDLTTLPIGARILGGEMAFEAMSSAAGTAQIQVGDGTTADKYLGTTSVDAAGTSPFANTIALNFGEVLEAETTLKATAKGEAWAAAKKLAGWVKYALD
jgi:hypothetical protein